MTDKEKLEAIKAEVERLMYAYNLEADIASAEDAIGEKVADGKYNVCKTLISYINSLLEEPVSEDLKEIAWNHADKKCHLDIAVFTSDEVKKEREKMQFTWQDLYDAVMFGANWQKEQFEKNRLKHCNSITNEQAELEQGFIDQHLDKYQRMPTFLDAVEYGMRLQKEQMMAKAIDAKLLEGHLIRQEGVTHPLHAGDKVKVIVIKED